MEDGRVDIEDEENAILSREAHEEGGPIPVVVDCI